MIFTDFETWHCIINIQLTIVMEDYVAVGSSEIENLLVRL
jgi:hypothetical protein